MANYDGKRELWQEFATRPTAAVVLETGVFSLIMILALVGNLLVCGAVFKSPRLRCPSNYYIVSLALSDISQAIFSMPFSVGMLSTGRWPFSSSACHFMAVSKITLAQVSVYTMSVMAINRFYKIVKPAKYKAIFKKKTISLSAFFVWIMAILFSVFGALIFGLPTAPNPGYVSCFIEFGRVVSPLVFVVLYTPFGITLFCYYKIYSVVRSHNANVLWKSANVEDVKVTKTLLITVTGFTILWLPALVTFSTSAVLDNFFSFPRLLTLMATLLVFISSSVNPFIYGFKNSAFRREFRRLLPNSRRVHSIEPESSLTQA